MKNIAKMECRAGERIVALCDAITGGAGYLERIMGITVPEYVKAEPEKYYLRTLMFDDGNIENSWHEWSAEKEKNWNDT